MRKWRLVKKSNEKVEKALDIFPPFLRELLMVRGLKDKDTAEKYLNPDYERDLFDPFLMLDMEKAVKRILTAVKANEKIIIYGDYDADGVPGTVVLSLFFQEIGYPNFDIYIPDRHIENYGLNDAAIEQFAAQGIKLVITVDCGITDVPEIKKAKAAGIDVVVTDHHLVKEKIPKALAIVDNKQEKDDYPFKMLCGCAVAYKLVRALMARSDHEFSEGWDKWLLDLVAISTIGDMVPMTGENRTLTYFGLKVLKRTRRPGLDELFRLAKIRKTDINEDDIGFMIAPRLNAASRMSHANQAYFLLTTKDQTEAKAIAKHIEEKNQERKAMVDEIFKVIDEKLAGKELPNVVVAGDESWSTAGLGLVCNKLKDKYGKTVFVWGGNDDNSVRGSGRSDGSVNMVNLMTQAGGEKMFADFGGHAFAAGFSLAKTKLPVFESALNEAYSKMDKEACDLDITVDRQLSLDEVTWENYYFVEQLGPYGIGNPKPVFLLANIEIVKAKTFGNGGIHLELGFKNSKGQNISAIGFFTCSPMEKFDAVNGHIWKGVNLAAGQKIDLLANLEKSTFKSYPELRLRIVDIRNP